MDNIMNQYQAVVADLELRRNRCQKELAELEQTIAGLKKVAATTASLFMAAPIDARPEEHASASEESQRYAGMSVRWGILKLLSEYSPGPLKSSEIAGLLATGGIVSKGRDFTANVSAVISNMVKERKELEPAMENGYYILSDNGRLGWAAIKHSPKYTNRGTSATLQ
jgi:hypothetical protein